MIVYTIGHSTRPIKDFISLLKFNQIDCLADIRTVPKSRRHPHFSQDSLMKSLPAAGITYMHISELGGLRKSKKDSTNVGWRHPMFRGYADHMQSEEFARGLEKLIAATKKFERVAFMCAEAVPWRCHRQMVADAMIAQGFEVRDIISEAEPHKHKLTPFAQIDHKKVTYPAEELPLFSKKTKRSVRSGRSSKQN